MPNGIFKKIDKNRGYGFIQPDSGQKDIFFHFTDLVEMEFSESLLYKRVSYDVQETEKGPRATVVRGV